MSLTFKVSQIGDENFTDDNGSASGNFTSVHTLINSAANMAGNYPSNKSFVIIGKLEDKFTSVEFFTTVATESVVMSYDKNGRVGIGKVAEFGKPGSLDVLGDIYSNNNPIQQHQLTSREGISINTQQNPDTILQNGMYYLLNGENRPHNRNGWLLVQVYANPTYAVQTFWFAEREEILVRHRIDGRWKEWKKLVKQEDITELTKSTPWQNANLQNGWSHHRDYGNVQFSKTFDGIVYLKGTCRNGTTNRETLLFNLPEGFRPTTSLFKSVLNNDFNHAVIGIYPSGNVVVKHNVDSKWLNLDNVSFKI